MSQATFEEFCLPSLVDLSQDFGGIFVHCCAAADHLYGSFKKIPNLRGLNRVFQAPGPGPAIEVFSDQTVLLMAGLDEDKVEGMVKLALPRTRLYFNMGARPLEEGKTLYQRLRSLCPRPG